MIMKTLHTIYTNFAKRMVLVLTLLLTHGVTTAWAAVETVDFSQQGYGNGSAVSSYTGTGFSVSFAAGTNSNAPKYYSSGTAIRCYGGNKFTVTSTSNITKVVITFGSSDGSNAISTNVNSYSSGTWEGTSKSITFTIGGTSGNRRIQKLSVTYESGYSVTYNNGGRGTAPSNTTASSVKLSAITATGYTNTGWKADVAVKNGSNTISAGTLINNGTTVTLTQATTFTAQWQANKYTITLDNQSATSTGTTSVIATYDSNSNLTSAINVPSKTHHNFGGYYTQTNGNGTQLIDSEGKFKAGVSGYTDADKIWKYANNITLYAKWTEKNLVRYRTSCECIPPTVTIKPITEFGWRYSIGETIGLNAIVEGASGDCTYQWQKYVVDQWQDIAGATSETFTKEKCTTDDGGSYRCVVNAGNDCIAESEPYYVRVFTLNGYYYNEEIAANKIEWTGENTGVATIHLGQSRTYLFKVTDNEGKWFGYGDYAHFNYIVQPWQADCGIETGNGTNTDIRLFTGPEGDYTFTINIEHALDNEPYVNIAVAYPEVEHPIAGYGYVTKWWDNCYIHWWDNNDQALTEWGNDAKITTYTEICETEYYYFPIIDNYINLIIKDAAGDPSNTTGNQTQTGHSGWYITHDGNSWGWHEFATYTITFDANGGNGTMDALSGICPTTDKTLTTNAFTRSGYTLAGWKANKNVTINGVSVVAGTLITDCATIQNIVSDITLTAQWTPKNITITWDANGGSVDPTTSTYTYDGTPVELPTPTRANYIFNGWFIAATGGTKITEVGTNNKPTEDVTYYAQWTEKSIPTFKWSADSYTAALEADNTFPTLSNPNNLSVTYKSSDENVAKIDVNGNVILGAVGETEITATGAETATHKSATTTYKLTVVESNCRWVEVEIGDITYGDDVLIAVPGIDATSGDAILNMLQDPQAATNPTIRTIKVIDLLNGTNVPTTVIWNIRKRDDNQDHFTIYRKGSTTARLAFVSGNDIRVGSSTSGSVDSIFTITTEGYLQSTQTSRNMRMSSSNDWRHYTTAGQTLKFYKRECLDATNYWVTWDAGEGAWTDGSSKKLESYQVDATIIKPTEPTREGYRFDGWSPTPTTMPAHNTTFTAVWTKVYKVTWYENGVPTYTYVPSDNPIVTWEDNIADCGEKKFYGWTADDTFVSDPTTPPTCITKGITINGDATYYAVYADAVEPANPGYVKVTTISEGTYLIATDNTANKAYTGRSGSNTYGGYCAVEIVDNVIKKLESAVEVEVTLNGSNFYMHDGTYYLGYEGSSNNLYFSSSKEDNRELWKLNNDGSIESVNVSGRLLQYNSGSPRFACYTSSQKKAYLYKKQTTSYENFAVSCDKYTITVTPPTGGTVTTTPADEAGAGQEITINVTPDDCKYLTALKYNDGSDHSINIASTPYTFTMPAADVTVTATFADKNATDIEIITSAHRLLMQGSAFVGEQVRITYNNGDKETLNWNDSRLTFTGHNTATLGRQTVTVTYNGCSTQSASYNIEVIDGLGITFWDGDYTETIKYEPGDLVDVDSRIGQNICSGWEFVGWSETKVANESNGFTPVHNFNATEAKVLYAVYVETSTDWISAYNIDELHPGAKYVIVYHYGDSKEYALTNTNNTNSSYLDGANLTTDCEEVREGDAYPYKDRYKLKVTPDENWKWQLENTGSGWTMRNIKANKYLKINTDKTISLTTTPDDKFTLSNGYNDSEITAKSSSNNYLSWYNSYKYWNGHTSGQQYYLTNETNFTSTPPCSPLSATFHGNGGIVTDGLNSGDDLTITEPTRDAGITTPTASFADCNGKTWTFVGWAREEIDVTRVPVLTTDLLHDGGGNKHYDIEEDGEEFWAVFTNIGNPETKYGTITFTDADVTRQYENAKTITKSVTAMGDYDFELYHVSNASSKGIQFDHEVATRGYIKNITSLGKINSISLNEFQVGDINDVKVYVGNTPNAINTLLTEADLQQTGDTYTYYPPKNYAYVKIEATGYCGITSILIDFGKGTQIWATTPDCSTITLSGDNVYVTSTNGQSIRAAAQLTVRARQLPTNLVLTSNNSDVYFSTEKDANFTKAVAKQPKQLLTLDVDGDGNLDNTTIYVHYKPSSEGNGISEEVVVSATLETPKPAISDEQTIHVRSLPADFVIAAKWGDNWYAMPANMDSQSSTEGWLIEVDDAANPTKAIAAPNTTKYGLKSVYTSNSTADRYEGNGESLVFVENVTEATPVTNKTLYNGGDASSSKTNIQVYAQYANYYSDQNQAPRYEWIPTTTDLTDYTLTSGAILTGDAVGRTVSLDNHGIFGTLLQDKSYNGMVRLLPVDNFYAPAELQVVEWKQNSVSVMYTGAGSKYTTKVGNNAESSAQTLSSIDHAVYSLSTADLTSATNQPLIISIKNDANATIGSIKLTIPAIVATDKSSTALGVAEENAKATSIVVLDGATLTAATTTKYTYDDITVYPGGKLVIGQSGRLGMYTLTLRAGSSWGAAEYENKYPQLLVRGDYSNTSGQINLDYVTTQDYYYPLSVPEQVTIADIKYPLEIYGSNVEKANTGSFQLKYYDGKQRATGATGWVVLDEKNITKLSPNSGYAFWGIPKKVSVNGAAGVRQTYGIHRIPIKIAADKLLEHEKINEKITIQAYAAARPNDQGWNYLGNPYLAGLGGMNGSDEDLLIGLLEKEMVDGKWTGGWVYNEESVNNKVRYITITNDCQTFEAKPVAEAQIPAFTTFFIQAASVDDQKILLSAPASVLNVSSLPARHYAAQQETAKEITTGIILTGNDQTDRTGLLIADNFTEEYDFNADLSKFENSGINLYTIGKDGKLAYMATNQALAEQPIPVGYSAPAEGLYTIAFDEDRYNATDISALYLIDYDSNEKTNLLHTDYSFVTAAGTNDQRFALQVAFAPENATNVEWVGDATIQVGIEGNELILNNLPTDAAVHVFDALGRLMYHTPHAPTEMQLTLPTGYYLVRIADKQNAVVTNIVIP